MNIPKSQNKAYTKCKICGEYIQREMGMIAHSGKPREAIFKPTEEYAKLLQENKAIGINNIDFFPRVDNKNLPEGRKSGFEKRVTAQYKKEGYSDCGCQTGFSSGIVLDPFFGAGTTGLVALKLNRKFIGIEINPDYIKIAKRRLKLYLEQRKLVI